MGKTNAGFKEALDCIDNYVTSTERLRQLEMMQSLILSTKSADSYRFKAFDPLTGETKMMQAVDRNTNVNNGKIILMQEQIIKLLLRKID